MWSGKLRSWPHSLRIAVRTAAGSRCERIHGGAVRAFREERWPRAGESRGKDGDRGGRRWVVVWRRHRATLGRFRESGSGVGCHSGIIRSSGQCTRHTRQNIVGTRTRTENADPDPRSRIVIALNRDDSRAGSRLSPRQRHSTNGCTSRRRARRVQDVAAGTRSGRSQGGELAGVMLNEALATVYSPACRCATALWCRPSFVITTRARTDAAALRTRRGSRQELESPRRSPRMDQEVETASAAGAPRRSRGRTQRLGPRRCRSPRSRRAPIARDTKASDPGLNVELSSHVPRDRSSGVWVIEIFRSNFAPSAWEAGNDHDHVVPGLERRARRYIDPQVENRHQAKSRRDSTQEKSTRSGCSSTSAFDESHLSGWITKRHPRQWERAVCTSPQRRARSFCSAKCSPRHVATRWRAKVSAETGGQTGVFLRADTSAPAQ